MPERWVWVLCSHFLAGAKRATFCTVACTLHKNAACKRANLNFLIDKGSDSGLRGVSPGCMSVLLKWHLQQFILVTSACPTWHWTSPFYLTSTGNRKLENVSLLKKVDLYSPQSTQCTAHISGRCQKDVGWIATSTSHSSLVPKISYSIFMVWGPLTCPTQLSTPSLPSSSIMVDIQEKMYKKKESQWVLLWLCFSHTGTLVQAKKITSAFDLWLFCNL